MPDSNKYSRLKLRRGSKATLKALNPLLLEGEPMVELDTGRMKVGDGVKRWNALKYVGGGSGGSVPSISTFKIVSLRDTNNNEYTSTTIPQGVTINYAKVNYILTASPDSVTVIHNGNNYGTEQYPEVLTKDVELNGINISSSSSSAIKKISCTILSEDIPTTGSETKDINLTFAPYIYWGVSTHSSLNEIGISGSSINRDSLLNLFQGVSHGSKLITGRTQSLTGIDSGRDSTGDAKYIFIFVPKTKYTTDPIFKVGELGTGGFVKLTGTSPVKLSISEYGYTNDCDVWRTEYNGHGVVTVNIS